MFSLFTDDEMELQQDLLDVERKFNWDRVTDILTLIRILLNIVRKFDLFFFFFVRFALEEFLILIYSNIEFGDFS